MGNNKHAKPVDGDTVHLTAMLNTREELPEHAQWTVAN